MSRRQMDEDEEIQANEHDDNPENDSDNTAIAIENAIAEIDTDDARLTLMRRGDNGKWARLASFTPTAFDIGLVQQEYGGGDYKLFVYQAKEKGGKKQLKKSFEFEIDKSLPKRAGKSEPTTGSSALPGLELIQNLMNQQAQSSDRMVQMLMTQGQQTMQMMVGMMSAIATAMGGQQRGIDPAIVTLLTKQQAPDNATKMIEMFKMGLELKNGEPEKEKAIWEKVLEAVAAGVTPAIVNKLSPDPTGSNVAPSVPQLQTASQGAQLTGEQMKQLRMIAMMNRAMQDAAENKPVDDLADYLIDEAEKILTGEEMQQVEAQVRNVGCVDFIISRHPSAAPHKEYLIKLRESILSALDAEEPISSESGAD